MLRSPSSKLTVFEAGYQMHVIPSTPLVALVIPKLGDRIDYIGCQLEIIDWTNCQKKKSRNQVYSTRYSQAVTHPSTGRAQHCLSSVTGREPVISM